MLLAGMAMTSCKDKMQTPKVMNADTTEVTTPDTTIYGICGEGTSMHSLELVTNEGDTLTFMIDDEESDNEVVQGGLLCGDKLAVIGYKGADEMMAQRVLNLTTLEGKWTSLDRNFEIIDGGEVISTMQSESNPYNAWKILNGQLLLGRDTFDILTLGADSLEIENSKGIFVYKRQK